MAKCENNKIKPPKPPPPASLKKQVSVTFQTIQSPPKPPPLKK